MCVCFLYSCEFSQAHSQPFTRPYPSSWYGHVHVHIVSHAFRIFLLWERLLARLMYIQLYKYILYCTILFWMSVSVNDCKCVCVCVCVFLSVQLRRYSILPSTLPALHQTPPLLLVHVHVYIHVYIYNQELMKEGASNSAL